MYTVIQVAPDGSWFKITSKLTQFEEPQAAVEMARKMARQFFGKVYGVVSPRGKMTIIPAS